MPGMGSALLGLLRGAVLCLLMSSASAADAPLIAIILDDLGNDLPAGRDALDLPGAVTYSFLPKTPHARLLAAGAAAQGREVMLHLPMQSLAGEPLGSGGLTLEMSARDFRQTVLDNIRSVPAVAGINNHMGSRLTRDTEQMARLMTVLREHGDLYFLDSRTDDQTVAEQVARETGVPTTRRNIFLDNERNEAYIRGQFLELLANAREQGAAVAIGHPYPETLAVLERELADLETHGVVLVPVSRLIEHQRRNQQWPVFSSPLRTAAKNLKP